MNNSAKRASIYLGVFLAIVMLASVFAPLINQRAATTTTDTTLPTETIVPTFPPPPTNLNTITFDKVYLHPSGIFSIGQPDGWNASQPNKGATIAQINMINNDMLAVVDSYVDATPLTADKLSGYFSESVINASWSNFSQWSETNRVMQDDRLTIDFNVTLSGRTYVARQIVWTDNTWIYVVRVLVPENATDLLRYLLDNFVKTLQPQTEFRDTPFDWDAYYDPDNSHIIRYPSDWKVTDTAKGRPTSISNSSGSISLRVEARDNTSVADEAAARAFVEKERAGISVVSAVPVTRGLGQGFSVAYSYTTVDGSKESGLSVLLNGPDGKLHIANLLFPTGGIDLNQVVLNAPTATDATAEATSAVTPESTDEIQATATAFANVQGFIPLAEVMSTFNIIAPLNLSAQSLPTTPTPTPLPLATLPPLTGDNLNFGAVTSEPTAEVTGDASIPATPGASMTEAASGAATSEATAEATAAS